MLPGVPREHHYPAELYELVHLGTPGDLAFYRRACSGVESVLELGSGYGRVLEALSDVGAMLTGLEHDPAMLALAEARCSALPRERASRIELVLGDMCEFDLGSNPNSRETKLFDRILIPHNGIYCLQSDEACVSCFRRVAKHLKPGGRLILDAYLADHFHAKTKSDEYIDERLDPVVSVEYEGGLYDVYERSQWTPEDQRLDVTYEYIPRDGGEALQGSLVHRYLLRGQLEALLEQAGLRLTARYGDFQGATFDPDGELFVAIASPVVARV